MIIDRAAFFKTVQIRLSPLNAPQVTGFGLVLDAAEGAPLSHRAYMLATAWHETNKTMQPVREAYWLSEEWRRLHLRYYPWYGRGYVQLTWEPNYRRADSELDLGGTLIAKPDRAMEPEIAAKVLRKGMDAGWFTGVQLAKVLPLQGTATREQYMNARTIINGRDKSDLIEDYAQIFERALRDGGLP
jgi:putative chitinase